MASVSLTVIVKNEASNIEACIAPLKDIVDEIVVVDTGSTDDTVAIAERLGARVVHFPWCDSFAAARNHAIENARADWIFILDADDRILPSEGQRLRDLFASLDDRNVGYMFRSVSLAIDGGVGTELEQVRLFRRRPDLRWRYRVHEQIVPALHEAGAPLVPTGIRIAHVGYRDPTLVDAKSDRNLRLLEMDLSEHPDDVFLACYRALMLADLGRNAEAIVALSLCAPMVPGRSEMGRSFAMGLTRVLRAEGQLADALATIRASRELNPDDVALACIEAELLIQIADLSGAGAVLASVASESKPVLSNADLRARVLLAEVLLSLGHIDGATQVARAMTENRPAFGPAWLVLADTLYARGLLDEASAILARFSTIAGGEAASVILQAASLLHQRRSEEAQALIEGSRGTNPSTLLAEFQKRILERSEIAPPLVSCLSSPWSDARATRWNATRDRKGAFQVHLGA